MLSIQDAHCFYLTSGDMKTSCNICNDVTFFIYVFIYTFTCVLEMNFSIYRQKFVHVFTFDWH